MDSNKVNLMVNGKPTTINIPIFFNNIQGIKILRSQQIQIPTDLILVSIEYDEIKNSSGVCAHIGPENSRYIITDFRHDCEVLMKNFQSLNDDEKTTQIQNIKEKYSIVENQKFVNYLKGTFKNITALLNFIFDFLNTRPQSEFTFNEMLVNDKQIFESIEDVKSLLQKTNNQYVHTNITTVQTNIDLFFELQDVDMSELFNRIHVSQELPLAIYNSYFKILKSFDKIPEEMIQIRSDNSLTLYVLNTSYIPQKIRIDNYTRIIINEISSTERITKYKVNITSNLNDGLDETGLIQRIIKFLPKKPLNCSYKQNDILIEYYMNIKVKNFYEQMFSDYIMLDDLISTFLLCDESDIITRQKGGFLTYFRPNKFSAFDDFININISQIKVKPFEHKLHKTILKIDDNALHIKIKGIDNIQKAIQIQNFLDSILTDFIDNKQDKIINEYKETISDIHVVLDSFKADKEKIAPPSFLKYDAPDIFTGKFASKCSGREPTLISEQEAELLKDEMDILKFPLFGEGDARYFRSDHETNPYVGLLLNDSPDAQYPYYPCCFGTDQKNNTKSLRYKYENKIEDEKEPDNKKMKKTKKVEIFTSPQSMEDGIIAMLNPKIKNTLEILDPESYAKIKSPYYRYLRIGTINSPNSVLDAIIKSIINYNKFNQEKPNNTLKQYSIPDKYTELSTIEKIQILKKVRNELKQYIKSNITSQSTYSYELDALYKYIENEDNYLNIRMFWNILEQAFDIKIFLFIKPIDENLSAMGTPIYTQNYLRNPNKSVLSILLLEHQGVKNIRLRYPQIENIVINMFTEDFDYNPKLWLSSSDDYNDKSLIDNLSELMNNILNYNGSINKSFDIKFKNTILSQWADSYGKIRLLQFEKLCILCDPIPPFFSPQINSIKRCDYTPCELKDVYEFLESEKIPKSDISCSAIENTIIGINFTKKIPYMCSQVSNDVQGIRFYIPIKNASGRINNIKISKEDSISPSFIDKHSIIQNYNKYMKISKFLKEYTVWLFSKYLINHKIRKIEKDTIYNFAEEGFIINNRSLDNTIEYPDNIEREFKNNIDNFVINGKLLVKNIQIRNRLLYHLNLEISRNKNEVIDFHKRTFIKNYFLDINDFIQDHSYVILSGMNMLNAWMNANTPPNYIINSRIIPGTEQYFFHIKNNIRTKFLAQPAKNLEHALYISSKWSIEKYNPGYYSEGEVVDVEYKLYKYSDFLDYSTYVEAEEIDIEGKSTGSEYTVLEYRQNNQDYYVALLPFIEC